MTGLTGTIVARSLNWATGKLGRDATKLGRSGRTKGGGVVGELEVRPPLGHGQRDVKVPLAASWCGCYSPGLARRSALIHLECSPMKRLQQLLCLVALCSGLTLCSSFALAQSGKAPAKTGQSRRAYDAVGRLMRNQEAANGRRTPPFVLVDQDGQVRCYVVSRAGAKLSQFLGQRVGVRGSVRFMAGDSLPLVLADKMQPVGEPGAEPVQEVAAEAPETEIEPVAATEPEEKLEWVRPAQALEPVARTTRVAANNRQQSMPRQVQSPLQEEPREPTLAELPPPAPVSEELLVVEPEGETPPVDSFPAEASRELSSAEPETIEQPLSSCDCEVCGGTSCTTCSACCLANDPGEWWVRGEYLAWATKGMYVPPLATTGPGATNPGILGRPGTVLLFGDEPVNGDLRSGGRIALGKWLNSEQTWGVSGEYFGLQEASQSFFAQSDANGVPTISRPYFTVYGVQGNGTLKPAGQNAELVALDDVLAGSLRVETNSSFQGGGVFLRRTFCCKNRCWGSCDDCQSGCTTSCVDAGHSGVPGGVRVGMFGGYRFMLLDDGVSITEDLTSLATTPADQGQFLINDSFNSYNQFHGAELGFITEARRARWTFEFLSRLALGTNRQTVRVNGSTVISNSQSDDGTYPGGLLALPTNIGSYSRNQFSVIPQLNANLGYNITPRLRAIVGYTFIYWGNVARAGDQISLDVNETYIPAAFATPAGPRRPAFVWQSNDFWAQGLNVGLDYFW